jgi:hypothetical protein
LRQTELDEEDRKALFDERAAILEYDGGFTRAEAERRAREEMNPPPVLDADWSTDDYETLTRTIEALGNLA